MSLLESVSDRFRKRAGRSLDKNKADDEARYQKTKQRMAHPKKVVTLRDQVDEWIWQKAKKEGKRQSDKMVKENKNKPTSEQSHEYLKARLRAVRNPDEDFTALKKQLKKEGRN